MRRGGEPWPGPLPRRYVAFGLLERADALVQCVVNLG
jgi:hypothetical protein